MPVLTSRLYNEDCLKMLWTIKPHSVDLVLCDPPYGTTQNNWDIVIPLPELWIALRRVVKLRTAIVLTSAQPFTSMLVQSNLMMFRYEWIWYKSKVSGVLNAKRQPLRQHENCLVFGKSVPAYYPQGLRDLEKPLTKINTNPSKTYGGLQASMISYETGYPRRVLSIPSQKKTVHPTQKPVELMEYFIKTYTKEGDTVLDFAMGSGTTGVACKRLNRLFIGCENDVEYGYFQVAQRRIRETTQGAGL